MEKDLTKTGDRAREQLEEYLEGSWRSGQEYRFTLLTTDGLRWRRYAPDWSTVAFGQLTFGRNFTLREIRRFDLTPDSFDEFPFFLDEVLFASQPRLATLENIQDDFGDTSSVSSTQSRVSRPVRLTSKRNPNCRSPLNNGVVSCRSPMGVLMIRRRCSWSILICRCSRNS